MTFLRLFIFTALFSVVASFAWAQTDKNGQLSNGSIYIKQLGFSRLLPINSGKKRVRKRRRYTLQSQRTILLSIKLFVTSK